MGGSQTGAPICISNIFRLPCRAREKKSSVVPTIPTGMTGTLTLSTTYATPGKPGLNPGTCERPPSGAINNGRPDTSTSTILSTSWRSYSPRCTWMPPYNRARVAWPRLCQISTAPTASGETGQNAIKNGGSNIDIWLTAIRYPPVAGTFSRPKIRTLLRR